MTFTMPGDTTVLVPNLVSLTSDAAIVALSADNPSPLLTGMAAWHATTPLLKPPPPPTGRQSARRQRSAFLTQAAENELMHHRQLQAIEAAAGAWKDADHPELKQGAAKYISKLRRQDEKRFKKVTAR